MSSIAGEATIKKLPFIFLDMAFVALYYPQFNGHAGPFFKCLSNVFLGRGEI